MGPGPSPGIHGMSWHANKFVNRFTDNYTHIRLVAKFSEHSEGRIRRWKTPDIKRINWKSTILNGHNKDEKLRTRCETTINLHSFSARNFSVRPGKPTFSDFGWPGRKPDKYRAPRPCSLLEKCSKILKINWKWTDIEVPGLRLRRFESQNHYKANQTTPGPKIRLKKSKI